MKGNITTQPIIKWSTLSIPIWYSLVSTYTPIVFLKKCHKNRINHPPSQSSSWKHAIPYKIINPPTNQSSKKKNCRKTCHICFPQFSTHPSITFFFLPRLGHADGSVLPMALRRPLQEITSNLWWPWRRRWGQTLGENYPTKQQRILLAMGSFFSSECSKDFNFCWPKKQRDFVAWYMC